MKRSSLYRHILAHGYCILLVVAFFLMAGGEVLAGEARSATPLPNPLGGETDIRKIIGRLINAALGIIGAIALLMFIIGGYHWLVSGGSQKQIERGKQTLVWASIGLIVVFSSYLIVGFLIQAFTSN